MQNAYSLLHTSASRTTRRQTLRSSTILAAALAAGVLVPHLAAAQALPSGGQVVAGAADIAHSGAAVTVTQTTDRAIIDWTNFSIGQDGAVNFNNGSGATLNRVTGGNLSSIDGLLSATGSVYLINPNGVVIGKSGLVKVGGDFVAATLDIGNTNFMAGGDLTFEGPSLASVVNLGQIGALGGDVALVAANVRNDGTITAPNGALGLLAGNKILMRDASVDDGKFLVLSGGAGTSATNTGNIEAATAELRAEGGNVYALAGNTNGLIRATGVSSHDGRIYLSAGTGSVEVAGSTLAATQNGDGGRIDVTGQTVTVASDATLDVSGKDHGGTAMIIADMSSGKLDFHGTAVAKGDLTGGFIETSGHKVDFTGARIDTTGAKSGTWLVDPDDLTVDATAAATINTNLATTNVTLQTTATAASGPGTSTSGNGDIIINSDIAWSSSNTLTFDSYHSINVNANVTVSGAGGVVLKTNNGGSGGDYYFAYGKSLSFTGTPGSGQSLTINGTAYTLLYTISNVTTMNASSGKFALAKSIDASGTTYTSSNPVGTFASGGIFTGLGNTISNLTINRSSSTVGLFGSNAGTLRDIGLAGGSVSGPGTVGSLVGSNTGTIANAWSSASVTSTGNTSGGLVGFMSGGTVQNSFTTGSISSSGSITGGLIGILSSGSVTNTFSTAAVTTTSSISGGLIGQVGTGSVSKSFATGSVNGSSAGGLTGRNVDGSVVNTYYDGATTGRSDTGRGTSRTTAQLQGTLPTGFSSSVWGTGTGLYPYLKSFFPNGVVAVSGTAYNSSNAAASKSKIQLYSGGKALSSTYSGTNGYYYIPVATGTTGSSAGVTQALSGSSTITGAAFGDTANLSSANISSLNVTSGSFTYNTAATSYATLKTNATSAFGSSYYTSLLSTLSTAAYKINASGSFSIDSTISATSATAFKTLAGDLSIDTPQTISGNKAVTFEAYDNLYIDADVTVSGTNAIALKTSSGGSGDYSFLKGKSLSFTNAAGAGQSLTINGNAHTLLYTQADLQGISGGTGYYALAKSLDLSGTTFTDSPVALLDGGLTGLGHTISNLNIDAPTTDSIGLFGTSSGILRDIGIDGGTIYGNWYSGALVGENYGQIYNAYSSADVHVVYRSGGLVGVNYGLIKSSHATGSVTSNGANGNVSDMGGLVGWNDTAGTINQSYATGTVTGTANTTGGLVAYNGGTITDSFATGGVFGNLYAGGLVGFSDGGSISNSYATGYVNAVTSGGGFAGYLDATTVTNGYWDTTSSGTNTGVGTTATSGTPTGLTRSTLQNGSLPTGFSSSVWATASGLYPYLKSQFRTGMQSISGYTYASNGAALPAATLAVYVDGAQVGGTTAASGADGYYYLMATPGTVTGTTKIGITETTHNASSVTGAAFADAPVLSNGQVTGFNVTAGQLTYTTSQSAYSTLMTGANTAFGSSRHSTLVSALDAATLKIAASGAFSLDQAVSRSGSLLIQSGGDMTLASTGSISSTATGTAVTLAANGSFINNAGSSAVAAGNGRWLIYTQANGNSAGAATSNSFGGLSGKNFYNNAFSFNAGTFATTPNSGNRFVTGYAPTLTVTADTKSVTYNGSTQTNTYGLSGYLTGDQTADSLTGSVTGLTTSSKNAGAYSLTASGTLASDLNYTIAYGSAGTLTIDTATLTLAAVTDTKTYDADATSTGTVIVTGLLGSDTVTGESQVFDSQNAGTRTLSVNGYTVNDGNSGGNYTVSTQTASGSITKAALTIAAGTDTKTYDTNATSTGTVTVTGLLGSDTVTGKSQVFDSQNAGSRTLTVNGYTVNDGNSGGNYDVTTQTAAGTISKASLTIAAGTDTKTYDTNATSNGTVTVTGLLGSDTVTGKTQAFDSQNAGSRTLTVNGYSVNDGNSGGNYDVTTQTAAGTISKASLTIAAGTDTKTYDTNATSTGTVTVTGLLGSDTVTGKSQVFDSQNAGSRTLTVNGYTVNDGNSGGNYDVTTQTAAGSISKASLTIAAGTDSKTYDTNATSTGTVTVTGLLGSDTVTGKSQVFDNQNAGSRTLTVNGYTVNDGNSGGNYDVTTQTAAGSISKANLTIAAGTDSKTYDTNATSTGTVTVTGLLGSDTVTGKSQMFDSQTAGTRTLSVNGYTVNDGNSGGNYDVTTQTAAGSISKANLTIAAGTDTKTYDTNATSTGTVTVTGLLGSDTVTGKSQVFDSQNAGTRTLSVNGYTVNDGNSGGNYDVTTQTAAGSISKANLTIAAGTDSKTYDTNATSTGTVTVTGLLGSDTVTGKSQMFDSQNAGTRTLTVNGYTVNDGNSGGNYDVSTHTAAGTIAKANLTIAAGTDSKTYDATTTSAGTVTVLGLKGSDTVTGATQTFDSKNAGARTLTVGGYTVNDGNSGGNYDVTTQTAAGTIAKASLTIAAGTDTKTYDATTTSAGSVTVTGLKGSDTVTGATQAFDSKNAGTRTLTVGGYTVNDGNSGGNYDVSTQTAAGTISKASLTIAAGTDSKTYDATTTSAGTVSITGLKGSDTVTGATQTFDSKNAGARTLTVGGYTVNDGNSGGNYTVATQTAAGSIAKANLAIAAGTDSKTYDATTTSAGTVTVSGLKGSDTVTGAAQAFDSKNAGTRTLGITGYIVNDGNSGGNYAVATQTASGEIAKAALTAGLTGSTTKTYDATLSATLTAGNYVLTGIKGSDTVTLNNPASGTYGDANTGTGKTVTTSGLALNGTDADNYTVNASAAADIGSITARGLTLTADTSGKNAGAADPGFTYVFTSGSLAGSDQLTGALARTAGEDPGTYDITQGSLAASSNYDVTFIKSAFTITAVALQNDPVVNPVSSSTTASNQPIVLTAPIGLSAPTDSTASDAGSASSNAASDSSGTTGTSDDGETNDAGSAAGDGNQEATGPSVQTAGQNGSTCADGDGCANTPYPTNQFISNSISFAGR